MWTVHKRCQMTIDCLSREIAAAASENVELRATNEALEKKLAETEKGAAGVAALAEAIGSKAKEVGRELDAARHVLRQVAVHIDAKNTQAMEVLAEYSGDLVPDASLPSLTFTAMAHRISSEFPRFQQRFSSADVRRQFPATAFSISGGTGAMLEGTVKYRGSFQDACAVIQALAVRITGRDDALVMTMDPKTRHFMFVVR
jgi:hypothetical protein